MLNVGWLNKWQSKNIYGEIIYTEGITILFINNTGNRFHGKAIFYIILDHLHSKLLISESLQVTKGCPVTYELDN